MPIPKRVEDRIASSLKRFQSVLAAQRARDVSEADTVTLVKDILADVFGYDKYAEITSEHAVRGTYCDLAVSIEGKMTCMVEVKAIGLELKDSHVKQAVDYASNQGVEWVILTNGACWRLYHVIFKKPIDKTEVVNIDMLSASARNSADMEALYVLTREGFTKSAMAEYRDRKDATSRYMLAAVILESEPVIASIRREIRRVSDVAVDVETIDKMLRTEVIKREVIEGDHADTARRRVRSGTEKVLRKTSDQAEPEAAPVPFESADKPSE